MLLAAIGRRPFVLPPHSTTLHDLRPWNSLRALQCHSRRPPSPCPPRANGEYRMVNCPDARQDLKKACALIERYGGRFARNRAPFECGFTKLTSKS